MNIKDKYIKVNGVKTRYWQVGNHGPVIVLVHGFAASVEYWMYNIEELAKYFRVIAVDMVGFGRTQKPKVKYAAELLSNFLHDFLIALKINQINLVGHSLGGAVCLRYTLDHPEKVKRLVLVNSAGFGQELPHGLKLLSLPVLGRFLLRFNQKHLYAKALRAYAYQKQNIPDEFIDRMFAIFKLPGTKRTMLTMLRQHATYFGVRLRSIKSILDNIHNIKQPTLIVWGAEDRLLPFRHTKVALQKLPNATLKIFKHCGHIPQMEKRAAFNRELITFLTHS